MKKFIGLFLVVGLFQQAQASEPNWQALAEQCFSAGAANFKMITSNPMAMDAFRKQLPDYAAKIFGFGPEVETKDITITQVLYNFAVGAPVEHADLKEMVAPIDGVILLQSTAHGKTHNILYSERIWARNVELSYNCHYDENFRMGAVHELPYSIDTFKAVIPGLKQL